jgi:hypothetical protein
VDSDWKLDLFASLIRITNYCKSSVVIIAYSTIKAHLIFTLRELVYLQTFRLPWPMSEGLTSADFPSSFLYLELSFNWNSLELEFFWDQLSN